MSTPRVERIFSLRLALLVLICAAMQLLFAAGHSLAGGVSGVLATARAGEPVLCPGMLTHAMLFPFLLAIFLPFLMTAGRRGWRDSHTLASTGAGGIEGTRRVFLFQSSLPITVPAAQALAFLLVAVFVCAMTQYAIFGVVRQVPLCALVAFSFGSTAIAVSTLFLAMGIRPILVQLTVSLLALLVLSSMFYADVIYPLVGREWQNQTMALLVKTNPVLTIAGSVFDIDLLRQSVMYSKVCGIGSGLRFTYSSWHDMSVWYLAVAVVAGTLAQGVMRMRRQAA
jgi:hypothetical protein